MVKFKFYINTPYGGHYNTHYAKTKRRAQVMIEQWNKEFNGTGYSVHLVSISSMYGNKLPEGYTCW